MKIRIYQCCSDSSGPEAKPRTRLQHFGFSAEIAPIPPPGACQSQADSEGQLHSFISYSGEEAPSKVSTLHGELLWAVFWQYLFRGLASALIEPLTITVIVCNAGLLAARTARLHCLQGRTGGTVRSSIQQPMEPAAAESHSFYLACM